MKEEAEESLFSHNIKRKSKIGIVLSQAVTGRESEMSWHISTVHAVYKQNSKQSTICIHICMGMERGERCTVIHAHQEELERLLSLYHFDNLKAEL
jgi:hypothetical protein